MKAGSSGSRGSAGGSSGGGVDDGKARRDIIVIFCWLAVPAGEMAKGE